MSLKLAFGRDEPKEPRRPEGRNLVRFVVGETCYAFDVGAVEEVANPAALTTLPDMGAAVAGVTDHRGRVIPVVDLRAKFGVRLASGRHTKWVLMRSSYGLVGFVVDRVVDVVSAKGPMTPPPRLGAAIGSRAIVGVVNVDGTLVFVLDEDAEASIIANVDLSAVGG
jgi:purine-binding chemotaxis protein CheW